MLSYFPILNKGHAYYKTELTRHTESHQPDRARQVLKATVAHNIKMIIGKISFRQNDVIQVTKVGGVDHYFIFSNVLLKYSPSNVSLSWFIFHIYGWTSRLKKKFAQPKMTVNTPIFIHCFLSFLQVFSYLTLCQRSSQGVSAGTHKCLLDIKQLFKISFLGSEYFPQTDVYLVNKSSLSNLVVDFLSVLAIIKDFMIKVITLLAFSLDLHSAKVLMGISHESQTPHGS